MNTHETNNLGFSVYVDTNKFKKKENSFPNFSNGESFKSALNSIYPKYINNWVDDSLILNCQLCNITFRWFERKHHCRACGCVFCNTCCGKFIKIPNFIRKPKERSTGLLSIEKLGIGLVATKQGNGERVCNECYNKIENLEKIQEKIFIAEFCDLETLFIMLHVSKQWYNAAIHYLSKFREIQYHQSDLKYTTWELNMLKMSENMLIGHPNWELHLIKAGIQLYYRTGNKKCIEIISSDKKKHSCWKLMCCRKCCLNLDILDYVEILKFIVVIDYQENLFWKDEALRNALLNVLTSIYKDNSSNSYVVKNSISLFCSVLVSLLNDFTEDIDKNFVKSNFDILSTKSDISFYLYDEIEYLKSLSDKSYGIMNLSDILKEYLENKTGNCCDKLSHMKATIATIINEKSTFNTKLPFIYPLDYNYNVIKINSLKVMKSNSCPVLLDVNISSNKESKSNVKFLIKKESTLRKEQLVSCVISLLLYRLNQHEILSKRVRDNVPTYQIKMLNSDIGIIEFVENSMTLREITDKGFTLQNYILNCNRHQVLDITKRKFSNSLAVSCCVSYLLGLGDRHLDNIMINKKGQIFNIDYGYLLENPKTNILGAPSIKVTQEMIDFLGGSNSEYYTSFTNYLIDVYDIMRLYKNIIINYYEMMGSHNLINWSLLKDKLESRFMTGLVCKDVKIILTNEIELGESISSKVNDVFHSIGVEWKKRTS
jgi:hypothetical protein